MEGENKKNVNNEASSMTTQEWKGWVVVGSDRDQSQGAERTSLGSVIVSFKLFSIKLWLFPAKTPNKALAFSEGNLKNVLIWWGYILFG